MLCEHAEPSLNALADGELSLLTAWRVRRHIDCCPVCAQEYANIQRISDLARTWRDETALSAPDTLRTVMPTGVAPISRPNLGKKPNKMIRSVPALLATSGIVVASLLGVSYVTSLSHPHAGVAFAKVQKAVGEVHSAHVVLYLETVGVLESARLAHRNGDNAVVLTVRGGNDPQKANQVVQTFVAHECWMRNDPPTLAWIHPTTGAKVIWNSTGLVEYRVGKAPKRLDAAPLTREAVLREILSPRYGQLSPRQIEHDAATVAKKWEVATTDWDVDGRALLRFSVEDTSNKVRRTLWADPKTRLPVRVVAEAHPGTRPKSQKLNVGYRMRYEFSYNQTPPAGIFLPQPARKVPAKIK